MRLHHALGLLSAFLLGTIATAQTTFTWWGQGALSNDHLQFNDPANWVGGVVPGTGDHLVFGPGPSTYIELTTSRTVGDITFSGITNGNYFVSTNGSTLTLNGNVTTTAGSQYWGLFDLPVILSAGNHTYTTDGTYPSIYHFNTVSGSGGIIKNGVNGLYLTTPNNYSGDTVLNDGMLGVGANNALGWGTVTLNGGTLRVAYAGNDVYLGNDFVFGETVNIDTSEFIPEDGTHGLTLGNGDGSWITPADGVSTVNLHLTGPTWVKLAGDMEDGQTSTTYNFFSNYWDNNTNAYYLSGYNTYTGGTIVQDNAIVIFEDPGSIPDSGEIAIAPGGYAGISSPSAQSKFLSQLALYGTAGTIGFENNVNNDPYTDPIDLSDFYANSGSVSIGTTTKARLQGLITPSFSNQYRFRSSGTLTLEGTNPLSGTYDVVSTSLPGDRIGALVLRQSVANTYSGVTIADGAAVVFDSAGALSPNTTIYLANGGYVSVTDSSGIPLNTLIAQVDDSITGTGVIGFDTSVGIQGGFQNYTYTDPVDLSALTSDVYLGTGSSGVTFSGSIITADDDTGDYFLTGYRNTELKISSHLTGEKNVHIGTPGATGFSAVNLTNTNNTYTGDTVIHSGGLRVSNIGALGTGVILANPTGDTQDISLEVPSSSTVPHGIILQSGTLNLYGFESTLTGTISGSGELSIESPLTLSGANTYSGGTTTPAGYYEVTATTNTAFGVGFLQLGDGSTVFFTSAAPQIGSLRDSYIFDDQDGTIRAPSLVLGSAGNTVLTINQTENAYFQGIIAEDTGIGSLIKNGAGTLTITGDTQEDNLYITPYSGGTTINAGRLIASSNTALGTGTVTLNGGELATANGVTLNNAISFGANGGRLGGNGTFSVSIIAGANVTLAPGASPGKITFTAGLTLAPGGSLEFEIQSANGAAGTGYDLVSISSGALDITATSGSPFTIKLTSLNASGLPGAVSDFSSSSGYTWMLFEGNTVGDISGFDPLSFSIDDINFANGLDGGLFSLTLGLNAGNPALFLNFSPVPEPSTYALMISGLLATLFLRRRRA